MNAARLLREITRTPLWQYDDNRLKMSVPPGVYAMHRHVTKDACNMQWTRQMFFNQGMPPIIPSPDGIFIAPHIRIDLKHSMKEYDPQIRVARLDDNRDSEISPYSPSMNYDKTNRNYGNEVLLPVETRTYHVFNIAGAKKPPSCMNKPMKIHSTVERNVKYEHRPLFTDDAITAVSSRRVKGERDDGRATDRFDAETIGRDDDKGLVLRRQEIATTTTTTTKLDDGETPMDVDDDRVVSTTGKFDRSGLARTMDDAINRLGEVMSTGIETMVKPIVRPIASMIAPQSTATAARVSEAEVSSSGINDNEPPPIDVTSMRGLEALTFLGMKDPETIVCPSDDGNTCARTQREE